MSQNDDEKVSLLHEKMGRIREELSAERKANELLKEKKYKEMSLLEISFQIALEQANQKYQQMQLEKTDSLGDTFAHLQGEVAQQKQAAEHCKESAHQSIQTQIISVEKLLVQERKSMEEDEDRIL